MNVLSIKSTPNQNRFHYKYMLSRILPLVICAFLLSDLRTLQAAQETIYVNTEYTNPAPSPIIAGSINAAINTLQGLNENSVLNFTDATTAGKQVTAGTDLGTNSTIQVQNEENMINLISGLGNSITLQNNIVHPQAPKPVVFQVNDLNFLWIQFQNGPGFVNNAELFQVGFENNAPTNSLSYSGNSITLAPSNGTNLIYEGYVSGNNLGFGNTFALSCSTDNTITLNQIRNAQAANAYPNTINMAQVNILNGTVIAASPYLFSAASSTGLAENPGQAGARTVLNLNSNDDNEDDIMSSIFQLGQTGNAANSNNQLFAGLTGIGGVNLNHNTVYVQVPDGQAYSYAGLINADYKAIMAAGPGGLSISGGAAGTGIQDIRIDPALYDAPNAYTGPTSIAGATLVVDSLSLPAASAVTIGAGGTLVFDQANIQEALNDNADDLPQAAAIYSPTHALMGAGQFIVRGGTLGVAGVAPDYTGNTVVEAGATLDFNLSADIDNPPANENWFLNANVQGNCILNGSVNLGLEDQTFNNFQGSGTINGSSRDIGYTDVNLVNNQSTTYSGTFNGAINISKQGPGSLTLTGINTYHGDTTINQGLLYVNSDSLPYYSELNILTSTYPNANAQAALFGQVLVPTLTAEGTRTYSDNFQVYQALANINPNNLAAYGLQGIVFNQTGNEAGNVYDASINGGGAIYKIGPGYLSLEGDYSAWSPQPYAVDTEGDVVQPNMLLVLEGTLGLNANMPNGVVIVGPNGTLRGSGTMPKVYVFGTFAPGNSIGQPMLTSLTLTPQSVLQIQITSAGQSDIIVTNEDTALDGNLNIVSIDDGDYKPGTVYKNVLTANGILSGEFTNILIDGSQLTDTKGLVTIVLGPNGTVSFTLTQAAVNLIDQIADINRPRYAEANAFVVMSNLGQQQNLITNRMSLVTSAPEYTTGLWATPYWNTLRLKSNDGSIACKSNTEGLTVGRDTFVENDALVGAAFGYENTHARYKNDSTKGIMNSLHAGIYGNYEIEDFCFEAVATGLASRNKYRRTVALELPNLVPNVGYNRGRNYSIGGALSLLAGYKVPYEAATCMPYIGVDLYSTRESRYTESSTNQKFSKIKRRITASVEESVGLRTHVVISQFDMLADVSIARSHFIHDSGCKSYYQQSTNAQQIRNLRYNYPIEVRAYAGLGYNYSSTISYELAAEVKARRSKFETSLMGSISIAM